MIPLVSAGPGDPGLLTIKGAAAIAEADVVVYDRLVGAGVLAMIPESAERIDVGKSGGKHPVPQDEINRILVEHAKLGKRVVRLKGGDSFLFGRGGEELEEPERLGLPFQVVPGVTASISVPAYAGIPVTHRDFTSSLHIITGHAREGSELQIDFESLVSLNGTLVFMMGVAALPSLCGGLLKAGMASDMPAAVIENGTTSSQRKLVTTLAELPTKAKEMKISPPSVIIVGKVCSLSDKFDWFSKLGLFGSSVLVTRPYASRGTLAAKLGSLGAEVIEYPCISLSEIEPNNELDDVLKDLASYSWLVFTSAYGAEVFFSKLCKSGTDIRKLAGLKIAAIGTETAKVFVNRGIFVDYVPEVFDAEHLGDGLAKIADKSDKLLLLRAKIGTPVLCEKLLGAGIDFRDVPIYDTQYAADGGADILELLNAGKINYVTFTSASTVEGFVKSFAGADMTRFTGVCIGRQTAESAAEHGINTVIAEKATIDSMVESILEVYHASK